MRYALLIYGAESVAPHPGTPEAADRYQQYSSFGSDISEAGLSLGGGVLHGTGSSTTVRVRDGRRVLTDGPFAATEEQLEGFYLIDVPDLDEAIDIASRVPGARTGSIEIRPLVEWR
jgi:hypothetical protein